MGQSPKAPTGHFLLQIWEAWQAYHYQEPQTSDYTPPAFWCGTPKRTRTE